MALDLIKDTGPGGNFAESDHTVRNFKTELITEGLIRGRKGIQEERGSLLEKAQDEVKRILDAERTNYMDSEVCGKVTEIVNRWKTA